MKTKIDNQAEITERGLKSLVSKRGYQNVTEAHAEWNNWDNNTTITLFQNNSHEASIRLVKSKGGKIKEYPYH